MNYRLKAHVVIKIEDKRRVCPPNWGICNGAVFSLTNRTKPYLMCGRILRNVMQGCLAAMGRETKWNRDEPTINGNYRLARTGGGSAMVCQ